MSSNEPWFKTGFETEIPAVAPVNSIFQSLQGKRWRFDGQGWVEIESLQVALQRKQAQK